MWLGPKPLVRLNTNERNIKHGEARRLDPTPGIPGTGDLHWEDESPFTQGFKNQWGLTLRKPEEDRKLSLCA